MADQEFCMREGVNDGWERRAIEDNGGGEGTDVLKPSHRSIPNM